MLRYRLPISVGLMLGLGLLIAGIAFTPKSSRIAFASGPDGGVEIWTMRPDGTDRKQVTTLRGVNQHPAWNPDRSKIAFEYRTYASAEVCIINADGSGLKQLTEGGGFDGDPAWSPAGDQIAFSSIRTNLYQIYIMNSDGSGLKHLELGLTHARHPAWSPDGKRLAFSGRDSTGEHDLYLANIDGSQVHRLTERAGHEMAPVWSPDGRSIAFVGSAGKDLGGVDYMEYLPKFDMLVIAADGSNLRQLRRVVSKSSVYESHLAWSADGREIAFSSTQDGDSEIYSIDISNMQVRQLTHNAERDYDPAWR